MAGLKTYKAKRRFDVTVRAREAKSHGKRGHAYVIQKHDATRLHYDLRLELDGVMKSWAVTRGPSLIPDDKRLAVEVEDHPIEYNKFEGTIPKGQYGGGTVMIWDRGTWTPEYDAHQGPAKGPPDVRARGRKAARRLASRAHAPPSRRKARQLAADQARGRRGAAAAQTKDILEEQQLSVEERPLDGGNRRKAPNERRSRRKPRRGKQAAKEPARKPRSRSLRKGKPKRKSKRKRAGDPLPAFVAPALATLSDKAPALGNWVHEIKFDGYRIQARLEDGKVTLLTRKGLDWTEQIFEPIAAALATLPVRHGHHRRRIDGQDEHGVSSFSLLQQDAQGRPHRPHDLLRV